MVKRCLTVYNQDADSGKPLAHSRRTPVVVVLVEGGLDAIDFALESIKCRIPLVVCAGTGRAADIIAYANSHMSVDGLGRRYLANSTRQVVGEQLFDAYKKRVHDDKNCTFEQRIECIQSCCVDDSLITIFNINRSDDFDLAILSAILKCATTTLSLGDVVFAARGTRAIDQLGLALKWNRADVAEQKIFQTDVQFEQSDLEDLLSEALISNKVRPPVGAVDEKQ
jgi:hypothetical protein